MAPKASLLDLPTTGSQTQGKQRQPSPPEPPLPTGAGTSRRHIRSNLKRPKARSVYSDMAVNLFAPNRGVIKDFKVSGPLPPVSSATREVLFRTRLRTSGGMATLTRAKQAKDDAEDEVAAAKKRVVEVTCPWDP